jgi:hypothetical protein
VHLVPVSWHCQWISLHALPLQAISCKLVACSLCLAILPGVHISCLNWTEVAMNPYADMRERPYVAKAAGDASQAGNLTGGSSAEFPLNQVLLNVAVACAGAVGCWMFWWAVGHMAVFTVGQKSLPSMLFVPCAVCLWLPGCYCQWTSRANLKVGGAVQTAALCCQMTLPQQQDMGNTTAGIWALPPTRLFKER